MNDRINGILTDVYFNFAKCFEDFVGKNMTMAIHTRRMLAMIRKLIMSIFCMITIMAAFPTTASADMGPKPSVVIDFEGLSGQIYYVTLLSSVASTGPYSAFRSNYYGEEKDYPAFLKFIDFEDIDGYYFLQYFQNCSETNRFSWGYYPPHNFKILLYFPEKDSCMVSEAAYERYAFDSYFTATIRGEIQSNTNYNGGIEVRGSYKHSREAPSLIFRIILTIAIELFIAIPFGFRNKKHFLFILAANLITQIVLNVSLNIINFNHGPMMFVFSYVLLELVVFIIEAILYTVFLQKLCKTVIPKMIPVTYALVANAASFVVGIWLAFIIPSIF